MTCFLASPTFREARTLEVYILRTPALGNLSIEAKPSSNQIQGPSKRFLYTATLRFWPTL